MHKRYSATDKRNAWEIGSWDQDVTRMTEEDLGAMIWGGPQSFRDGYIGVGGGIPGGAGLVRWGSKGEGCVRRGVEEDCESRR